MGELDLAPFCDGYHSTKRAKKNTLMNAIDFWLECKYLVEDQNWHPFTIITVGSDIKVCNIPLIDSSQLAITYLHHVKHEIEQMCISVYVLANDKHTC